MERLVVLPEGLDPPSDVQDSNNESAKGFVATKEEALDDNLAISAGSEKKHGTCTIASQLSMRRLQTKLSSFNVKSFWRSQKYILAIGLMVLIGFACLTAPVASQPSKSSTGSPSPSSGCVELAAGTKPSTWTWEEPSSWTWKEPERPGILTGQILRIKLSTLPIQTSGPETTPAPKPLPPPAQVQGENAIEGAKQATRKVNVCASLIRGRENQISTPIKLSMIPSSQSGEDQFFQFSLPEIIPIGIRVPASVTITSDLPSTIPSATRAIQASTTWLCYFISIIFVAIIYVSLALYIRRYYVKSKLPRTLNRLSWRSFDPAVISASDYGAASLGNLQILWFSFIVTWIMAFAWLETGLLLNPSPDLLALLGISGSTNVLAKSLKSNQQRLGLDTWNWLVNRKLLKPETEIDPVNVAHWRDFVIDSGVLDPSRYQLMIFGFLIGLNLLLGEISALQLFKIPEFFLTLQGISSGLYLFGKAVNPATLIELENYIKGLQAKEEERVEKNEPILTSEEKSYLSRTIKAFYGEAALGEDLQNHYAFVVINVAG